MIHRPPESIKTRLSPALHRANSKPNTSQSNIPETPLKSHKMPSLTLLKNIALFGVATALLVQGQTDKRPCGRRIAPCPESQTCFPNEPGCTDLNFCLGTCDYPSCGGFTSNPQTCSPKAKCVDDAREPGCGQACDKPGICVPNDQPTCDHEGDEACPNGTKCYLWSSNGPVVGGEDSAGICLLS